MKKIDYTREASKALRKMPANEAKRVRGKIEAYAADPAPLANNVKRLEGENAVRLRVGDWRVIMRDGEVLAILKIGPRGGVYE
ncbi:MAG: type II toxin-antitoxin system RelE/ParE family toxin [Pseudomonadota bacterium]